MENSVIIVGERYQLEECIGEGAFGEVYSALDLEKEIKVAVKLELAGRRRSPLKTEEGVYKMMQKQKGFPKLFWSGSEGDYNILVIELLGRSLEDLCQICQKQLSIATTVHLAEQMIERIETFHSKCLLHRDIKPDNFVMGAGSNSKVVYLIDYGLAKKYINSKTNTHIIYKENKSLIGTGRYSSINTHQGYEQSRRDDLECLGYSLIYLMKGSLPWQGLPVDDKKEKYDKIMEMKVDIGVEELCKNLPIQIPRFLYYCRNLKFDEKPDYIFLKKLFKKCFFDTKYSNDFDFDWNIIKCDMTMKTKRGDNDSNRAENKIVEDKKINLLNADTLLKNDKQEEIKETQSKYPTMKLSSPNLVYQKRISRQKEIMKLMEGVPQFAQFARNSETVPKVEEMQIKVIIPEMPLYEECDFNVEEMSERNLEDTIPSERHIELEMTIPNMQVNTSTLSSNSPKKSSPAHYFIRVQTEHPNLHPVVTSPPIRKICTNGGKF